MKKFIFVLILLCTIPLYSEDTIKSDTERMHIAVMDFEAKDFTKDDAIKLTEIMRSDIVNTGKFIVIERAQMGQILNEQGFQQTVCNDVSCAVEVGKMLSANKILVGTIMSVEGQFIITGRIVDVKKGIVEYSEKVKVEDKKDLVDAASAFIYKLTENINKKDTTITANNKTEKKEQYNYKVKADAGYLVPSGKLADLFDSGLCGLLSFDLNNSLMTDLSLGLQTGYFIYTTGKQYNSFEYQSLYVIPIFINSSYKFLLGNSFYIEPSAGLGYCYDSITYKNESSKTVTSSEFTPMLKAGILLSYAFDKIDIAFGTYYSSIIESDAQLNSIMINLSCGYRF